MAESEPAVGLPSTRATDGSFEQQHIVVVTPLEPRVRQDLVHRRTSAQFGRKVACRLIGGEMRGDVDRVRAQFPF